MLTNPLRYEHFNDIRQKLDNTIVSKEHLFYYCLSGTDQYVRITELRDAITHKNSLYNNSRFPLQVEQKIHSSDITLNVNTPELGYINKQKYTCYTSRIPRRQYHQALSSNNIKSTGLNNKKTNQTVELISPYFANMLYNLYPTLDETIYTLYKTIKGEKTKESQAFHKRFALNINELNGLTLYSLQIPLGYIHTHNKHHTIVIPNKQNHTEYWGKTLTSLGFDRITG